MISKELIAKIRHIEIKSAKLVNSVFSGEYHSVFRGRGMEFSEVREYAPGDDIREIDWNVTARTGSPHIKRFTEERELTLLLMVDCSGSGIFGTRARTKAAAAAEASAMIAFSALKNKDRVGLLLFTDKIELFIPPRKGKSHVLRILREILCFKPAGKGTDIEGALEYMLRLQKRRGIVFLISDFQCEGYRKALISTSGKHDLIAVSVHDPRERDLPPLGLFDFEDPETGECITVDTSDRRFISEFRKRQAKSEHGRERLFKSLSVDQIDIDTEKPVADALEKFFKMRMKRFR
ncbi:MAG: DUF58 domain-containing protein [Nitrospinota bacterium]